MSKSGGKQNRSEPAGRAPQSTPNDARRGGSHPQTSQGGKPGPAKQGAPRGRDFEPEPKPPVVVVCAAARPVSETLAEAIRLDLVEVLGEFQVVPEASDHDAALARVLGALGSGRPAMVMAADLLNPTPSLIEGLLGPLEEFAVVLAPGFSGEVLAVAVSPDAELTAELVSDLVLAVESGSPDVGRVTALLVAQGVEVFCQMPWYRASDPQGRSCCIAHMRALSAAQDEDFLAHRTQAALENAV